MLEAKTTQANAILAEKNSVLEEQSQLQSTIKERDASILQLQQQRADDSSGYKQELGSKDSEILRLKELGSRSESLSAELGVAIEEISTLKSNVEVLSREKEDLILKLNEKDIIVEKMKSDAVKMNKRLDIVEKNLEIQIAKANRRGPEKNTPSPFSPRASVLKNETNRSSVTSTGSSSLEEDKRLSNLEVPSLGRSLGRPTVPFGERKSDAATPAGKQNSFNAMIDELDSAFVKVLNSSGSTEQAIIYAFDDAESNSLSAESGIALPLAVNLEKHRKPSKSANTTTGTSQRERQMSVASIHSSMTAVSKKKSSQPDPEPDGWNNSKIIQEKSPSQSLKRSKSYASSLRKANAANYNGENIDGETGELLVADEPEFVNGQHRTTRALAVRVAELETLLDAAHQDLSHANALIESIESDHRYHLDKLKIDMNAMAAEKNAMLLTAQRELDDRISAFEGEASDLRLKCATQMSEIEKLLSKNVATVQASAETEIEVVALKVEREVWRGQVKALQTDILKLQNEARGVAEREVELEVKYEAKIAEIEDLKNTAKREAAIHKNNLTNIEIELAGKNIVVTSLMKDVALMKESLSDATAEKFIFETTLSDRNEEIANLTKNLDEVKNEHLSYVKSLEAQLNATIIERESKILSLTDDLNDKAQSLAKTHESESKLLEKLDNTIQELQSAKLELNLKITNHEEAVQSHTTQAAALKLQFESTLAEKDVLIVDLTSQISTLSHELHQGETKTLNMEAALRESIQTLEDMKQMIFENMAQKDHEIAKSQTYFQAIISEKDAALNELNGQVAELVSFVYTNFLNTTTNLTNDFAIL
ncbi:hypothetical protein HK100_007722, partial [Physocladia obscura]